MYLGRTAGCSVGPPEDGGSRDLKQPIEILPKVSIAGGTGGPSQRCQALKDKIDNIQGKIDSRLRDLQDDPLGLPGKVIGDLLKPSLSRQGHQRLIDMDKANLAAQKALYLAFCGGDPPNGPPPIPVPSTQKRESFFDKKYWERTTGLTGAALALYLIISEGSRLYPPRNLVPVP